MNYKIQSIMFNKNEIGFYEALDWIIAHGDKFNNFNETDHEYIFRQLSPKYLNSLNYTEYKTKRLNEVVSFIVVYKSKIPKNKTRKINWLIPWGECSTPSGKSNNTDFIRIY